MTLKIHGTPTVIDLSQEHGATIRIFASGADDNGMPTGVSIQFETESRDFYVAVTANSRAKIDRIINAMMKARMQAFGV